MNRKSLPLPVLPLDPFALDLEQTCLIEASAGTGKTYTIATLFVRLVAMDYKVESILVVTFTEAAAAELKLRIRKRLALCADVLSGRKAKDENPDDLIGFLESLGDTDLICRRLRYAVTCFDQAAVMTIHSFCYSVLRDNSFESGAAFDMELLVNSRHFIDQVTADFFSSRITPLDPVFLSFLDKSNITPATFVPGLLRALSRPGTRIVPENPGFFDVSQAYKNTVQEAAQILNREKEAVIDCIRNHDGVQKRSYTKGNLPKWLDACQELLNIDPNGNILFNMTEKGDPLYKFTRTRLMEKTDTGHAPPDHRFFDLCQKILEYNEVMDANLIALRCLFLDDYAKALSTMKQEQGACFFDDLINDLAMALEGAGGSALKKAVRNRYHACLIDEFQDTDPGQYRIFSLLFKDPGIPFFMIGDPKQAIYGFRGGDIFTYMTASGACDQRFTLTRNFRSAPAMVQSVNTIFSLDATPFGFELIPFIPVGTPESAFDRLFQGRTPAVPTRFVMVDRTQVPCDRSGMIKKNSGREAMADLLARDMLSILNDAGVTLAGKGDEPGTSARVTPGDMAVLVRTNNQAQMVYQALSRRKIPCYLSKTGSVYDSVQAVELFDILSAVAHPGDMGLIRGALSSSVYGASEAFLKKMDQDDALAGDWQERFAGYRKLWEEKGFVSMITRVLHDEECLPAPCIHLDERGLTNMFHLVELLSKAALTLGQDLWSPGGLLLEWFRKQLFEQTRQTGVDDELRLESDARACAIVTIHKSKGLEYPLVFLPFLWDAGGSRDNKAPVLYHDPKDKNALVLDLGSENRDAAWLQARQEEEAEDVRLLYVALTRASAGMRIYWGGFSGVESAALGRLIHKDKCKEDAAMMQDLTQLCAASKNSIEAVQLNFDDLPEGAFHSGQGERERFSPKILNRAVIPAWQITSYSALVRGHFHDLSQTGHLEKQEPLPDVRVAKDSSGTAPVPLSGFPKGAGAGDFFHKVFEEIDFCDAGTIEPAVIRNLERFGFSQALDVPEICNALQGVLSTRLETGLGKGFCLNEIPDASRLVEMEFNLTLSRFEAADLGRVFARDPAISDYAPRMLKMNRPRFTGFLKGFIDLVVCHEDQWYILDYKSNYLGPSFDDYRGDALKHAMIGHDYILQYHLYLAALDRYLSLRLKGYKYQTHFGGVFYLFIRGMAKDSDTGVFFHRPDDGVVKSMVLPATG